MDLPDYTTDAIRNDRESPQYDAFQWLKNDPNLDEYPEWRRQQRFALATLFFATTDENNEGWHNDDGWLGYGDECEWYFSTSSSFGQTTDTVCSQGNLRGRRLAGDGATLENVFLVNNALKGPIPPEVFLLTNIKSIDLEMNSLTGAIPPQVSDLQRIEQIVLDHNQLTGNLPVKLASLSTLIHLSTVDNKLDGQLNRYLGRLSSLRRLALAENLFTGRIPAEFGHMVALETLDLTANSLVGSLPTELGLLNLRVRTTCAVVAVCALEWIL